MLVTSKALIGLVIVGLLYLWVIIRKDDDDDFRGGNSALV